MKMSAIGHLIGVLAGILVNVCMSTTILADSIESKPVLVLRIVNTGQVSEDVLNHAHKHIEQIYRKSGVRIEWLTGDDSPETHTGTRR